MALEARILPSLQASTSEEVPTGLPDTRRLLRGGTSVTPLTRQTALAA